MTKPAATIFSQVVRDALAKAARTPETTPTARTRAIEKATKFAKQQHPNLFKKD